MANCEHDFVDWLAALGPTLATVFAGAATIAVYKRGEKLQRQLVRPLLAVRHQIDPENENLIRWIVQIKNEGQAAAKIDAITVVSGEEIVEPEPLQTPNEYWQGALYTLGTHRVRHVEGNTILPPLSMGSGANLVLFDAHLRGERGKIAAAVRRLEVRLRARSLLGDNSSFAIDSAMAACS